MNWGVVLTMMYAYLWFHQLVYLLAFLSDPLLIEHFFLQCFSHSVH